MIWNGWAASLLFCRAKDPTLIRACACGSGFQVWENIWSCVLLFKLDCFHFHGIPVWFVIWDEWWVSARMCENARARWSRWREGCLLISRAPHHHWHTRTHTDTDTDTDTNTDTDTGCRRRHRHILRHRNRRRDRHRHGHRHRHRHIAVSQT